MHIDDRIAAAAEHLYDSAIEIAENDPDIRTCNFETFCNVMWPDNDGMNDFGLSYEDYRYALQSAWEKVHV